MPADEPRFEELPEPRPGLSRWIEVPLATLGLLVLSPVWLVAALAVVATSPGGAFFRQVRMGKDGRPFGLYKLRSMRMGGDGPLVTASTDDRITPVGRWLRRTKIDEIPQLWNVVLGDMALVGPRPETPRYTNLADPRWRRVLQVRPGITDPMTLKLRDEEALIPSAPEEVERFYVETLQPLKLAGYLDYLSRRSATMDLGVLLATAAAIIRPTRGPSRDEVIRRGRV
jgi:lipopolysaccharide/colanic/teichoic acid biosynthesis glycosyltransferase